MRPLAALVLGALGASSCAAPAQKLPAPDPVQALRAKLSTEEAEAALADPDNLRLAIERREDEPELFVRFATFRLGYSSDLQADRARLRALAQQAGFTDATELLASLYGVDLATVDRDAADFLRASESLYRAVLEKLSVSEQISLSALDAADAGDFERLIRLRRAAARARFEYAWLRSASDDPSELFNALVSQPLLLTPEVDAFASVKNRWGESAARLASEREAGHVATERLLREAATRLADN
ncbi:MAG: hypothetical protein AAF654_14110 [Myxococcota bacterium]